MSEVVLNIENLSKQYRLGKLGTGTVSHDINRWWYKIRGKEDPYLKIGDVNDRTKDGGSEYVWSLRDINLEIKKGEVVGIIGKNGAGKSTLLKILSQVTPPTIGEVKVKGRIAALLEVGTGFHPELSGKENIFLNGAILGMTKTEIKSKLDEIIEFSGVAKYIDTPVKRYSSGMMVRLGFAVAAHLEPEILIVDEVLAVGDAEFQEKCLGKMKHISGEGRTVLFVSHNMAAIKSLTSRSILLDKGSLFKNGPTHDVVDEYINLVSSKLNKFDFEKHNSTKKTIQFNNSSVLNADGKEINTILSGSKVVFKLEIINHTNEVFEKCSIGIGIFTLTDNMLIGLKNDVLGIYHDLLPGKNEIYCQIDKFPLSSGTYKYNIIVNKMAEVFDWIKDVGFFDVENGDFFSTGKIPASSQPTVLINHNWK
jgi:lipopolysaccharide transport system ATP-binding protein